MATYNDREAFIPYQRPDLIELCLEDGNLSPDQVQTFRQFCDILSAYYHFEFHQLLEQLKADFAPFNPDTDTKQRATPSPEELNLTEQELVETFKYVLERANYHPLSESDLKQAFEEASLVDLNTEVNFDDFDQMVFFHRGDTMKTTTIKKFFREREIDVDVFERVALLLKYKDAAYFEEKKADLNDLNFTPGKTYVYLYKNIPRHDLELLFPNIQISMTLKDRLLFIIPAIGAAVPMLFRALPQILIVIGVILFFTLGPTAAEEVGADEEKVRNFMPVMVALLSLLVAFGGFAFKQYNSYKTKHMKFLKNVTDTLFFRMLVSNAGVFTALIDAAEEEETKEIILVYYHLLTHDGPLTREALDDRVEQWMEEKFGTKIDFDIEGPLRNLEKIRGKMTDDGPVIPLLSRDERGALHLCSLDESKQIIDYVWDNLFQYNGEREVSVAGVTM